MARKPKGKKPMIRKAGITAKVGARSNGRVSKSGSIKGRESLLSAYVDVQQASTRSAIVTMERSTTVEQVACSRKGCTWRGPSNRAMALEHNVLCPYCGEDTLGAKPYAVFETVIKRHQLEIAWQRRLENTVVENSVVAQAITKAQSIA